MTEPVETVEKDRLRVEAGVEVMRDLRFPVSGLRGNLVRAPVLALRFGAGERVEIQMSGSLHEFLRIRERFPGPRSDRLDFTGDSTRDWGDLTMATKMRMFDEGTSLPGAGFLFGITLPNASDKKGIGNDELAFFSSLLLEKNLDALTVLGNVGMQILGDPVDAGAQDDLLSFGLALLYRVHGRAGVLADFNGRVGPGGVGNEDRSRLRLGGQYTAGGFSWDGGVEIGFRNIDPSWGVFFGISREVRSPF